MNLLGWILVIIMFLLIIATIVVSSILIYREKKKEQLEAEIPPVILAAKQNPRSARLTDFIENPGSAKLVTSDIIQLRDYQTYFLAEPVLGCTSYCGHCVVLRDTVPTEEIDMTYWRVKVINSEENIISLENVNLGRFLNVCNEQEGTIRKFGCDGIDDTQDNSQFKVFYVNPNMIMLQNVKYGIFLTSKPEMSKNILAGEIYSLDENKYIFWYSKVDSLDNEMDDQQRSGKLPGELCNTNTECTYGSMCMAGICRSV